MALAFVDRPPALHRRRRVVSDNAGGARTAVAHLARRRPSPDRRSSTIGPTSSRRPSVCAAMARRSPNTGRREDRAGGPPGVRAADVDATVRELLASRAPLTALFTAQNLITLGALARCTSWPAGLGGARRLRRLPLAIYLARRDRHRAGSSRSASTPRAPSSRASTAIAGPRGEVMPPDRVARASREIHPAREAFSGPTPKVNGTADTRASDLLRRRPPRAADAQRVRASERQRRCSDTSSRSARSSTSRRRRTG